MVLVDDYLLTHIFQHDVQREQVLVRLNVKRRVFDSVHVQISNRAIDIYALKERYGIDYEIVDEQSRRYYALKEMYGIDTLEASMEERMFWRIELMMEAKVVCKHWRDVCRIALTDPVWFSAWTFTRRYKVPRRVVQHHHFIEDGLYRSLLPMEFTFDAEVNDETEDFSEYDFPETQCSGFFKGIHAGYENPIWTYCTEVKAGNPYRSMRGTLHNLQVNWDLEKKELSLLSIEFTFEGKMYNSVMDLVWDHGLFELRESVSFLKSMKLGVEMQGGYWYDVSALNVHDSFLHDEFWGSQHCWLTNPDGSPCKLMTSIEC